MKIYVKASISDDIKFEYRIKYPSGTVVEEGTIEDIIRWDKYIYSIDEQHNSHVDVPTKEIADALSGIVGMYVHVDDSLIPDIRKNDANFHNSYMDAYYMEHPSEDPERYWNR